MTSSLNKHMCNKAHVSVISTLIMAPDLWYRVQQVVLDLLGPQGLRERRELLDLKVLKESQEIL